MVHSAIFLYHPFLGAFPLCHTLHYGAMLAHFQLRHPLHYNAISAIFICTPLKKYSKSLAVISFVTPLSVKKTVPSLSSELSLPFPLLKPPPPKKKYHVPPRTVPPLSASKPSPPKKSKPQDRCYMVPRFQLMHPSNIYLLPRSCANSRKPVSIDPPSIAAPR